MGVNLRQFDWHFPKTRFLFILFVANLPLPSPLPLLSLLPLYFLLLFFLSFSIIFVFCKILPPSSDNVVFAFNFMKKPKFLPLRLFRITPTNSKLLEKSNSNKNVPLTFPASPDLFSLVSLCANLSLVEVEIHWEQPEPNLSFCLIAW